MSFVMKTIWANKNNYGSKRDTNNIKYIVIHYTGNDGDTAVNNGNYFKNNVVKASAHYFVDSNTVVNSVPDDYVAYSVGGSKYSNCSETGGGTYYNVCTNSNSLSIELCDDSKDKRVYPSEETIANALKLTEMKMKEYGIKKDHVIRHFDRTGKMCPDYWAGTAKKNNLWKTEFWNKIGTSSTSSTSSESDNSSSPSKKSLTFMSISTSSSNLNCRKTASSFSAILGQFAKDQEVLYVNKPNSDWIKVTGKSTKGALLSGYCSADYLRTTLSSTNIVKVSTSSSNLNCRKTASSSSTILGQFAKDQEVVLIQKTNSTWYKVKGMSIDGDVITGYCSASYLK